MTTPDSTTGLTLPSIPITQQGLVASGPGTLRLATDLVIPTLDPEQVLVKAVAVALNPADFKLLDQSTTVGAISGSDVAGVIVKVGRNVRKPLKVGDRVCGVIFGSNPACPSNGAHAEYVALLSDQCLRIPSTMSFEAASSMGMGVTTVGLAFRSLGLSFPVAKEIQPTSGPTRPYVLVYGGATATGTIAIQSLRLAGYLPVTTCSPSSFDRVKELGAVAAFDYHLTNCKGEIRAYTGGRLAYALDCIGNSSTMLICYGAIGDAGGRYVALEAYPERLKLRRRDVKPDWVLGWTVFGKVVELAGKYRREPSEVDRRYAAEWIERLEPLLDQ